MQQLYFRSLYLDGSLSWMIKSYSSDLLWPGHLSFDFRQASCLSLFALVSLVLSSEGMFTWRAVRWLDAVITGPLKLLKKERCSEVIWIFLLFTLKKRERS